MPSRARAIWLGALLASCGSNVDQTRAPTSNAIVGEPRASVSDERVKIGEPYVVNGVTYTPHDRLKYDEVGLASWYGEELHGGDTANGEPFSATGVSAAHRTLPLPSYVEVTALDTGRTILVRINDRGPFPADRLIDLSRGAAEQLGIMTDGSTPVRVRRVNPPEQERTTLRNGGRATERPAAPAPLLKALQKRLGSSAASKPATRAPASSPVKSARVNGNVAQVGAFASRDRAEILARRICAAVVQGGGVWRVRLGPYPTAQAAGRAAASKGFAGAPIMANDMP